MPEVSRCHFIFHNHCAVVCFAFSAGHLVACSDLQFAGHFGECHLMLFRCLERSQRPECVGTPGFHHHSVSPLSRFEPGHQSFVVVPCGRHLILAFTRRISRLLRPKVILKHTEPVVHGEHCDCLERPGDQATIARIKRGCASTAKISLQCSVLARTTLS